MMTGSKAVTPAMYFYRTYLRCWALFFCMAAASVYVMWESWWGGAVFGILLCSAFGVLKEIQDVSQWIVAFDRAQANCTPGDHL